MRSPGAALEVVDENGHAAPELVESGAYERLRRAVSEILATIDDPERDGLKATPDRVARMYMELAKPQPFKITCFPNTDGYDQMIVEDDLPFYSLCEHHLVPFFGTARVAYVPGDKIVGLSKLARVVDHFARGLQTQEGVTNRVADCLMERLSPRGVGVRLSAEHLCMSMRGVRKPGAHTVTTALRGVFKEGPTREEFLR